MIGHSALVVALSRVIVLLVAIYWFVNREVREPPTTESLDENSLTNQIIVSELYLQFC